MQTPPAGKELMEENAHEEGAEITKCNINKKTWEKVKVKKERIEEHEREEGAEITKFLINKKTWEKIRVKKEPPEKHGVQQALPALGALGSKDILCALRTSEGPLGGADLFFPEIVKGRVLSLVPPRSTCSESGQFYE